MLENLFKSVIITSFAGTLLSAILFALKPLTRRFFSARWNYYIWVAALLVMVLPVKINMPEKKISTEQITTIRQEIFEETNSPVYNETDIMQEETEDIKINNDFSVGIDYFNLFSAVWAVTAIGVWLFKTAGYNTFLRNLKRNSYEISCPELEMYTKKKVTARKAGGISSPFITGIIKPVLVLPDGEISEENLINIISHEAVHLKRKDILIKCFSMFVKSVHWFNPAVYFIDREICRECEISCDMEVVRTMGKEEKTSYMNTILELVSGRCRAYISTGMTDNKKELKKRFMMIKNKKSAGKKAIVVSAAAGLLLVAAALMMSGLANGTVFPNSETIDITADESGENGVNMLFVGADEGGRCDTVLVLSASDGTITGISIPRDVKYQTAGGSKKLSEIMAAEGHQAVFDAVKQKLSIPISYYTKINLSAVERIVDTLGGVEFEVPMDMNYSDPEQNLNIQLKKGKQHLTGEQVRGLLQYRRGNDGGGYENGDIGRIALGQSFIKEFVRQHINGLSADKISELVKTVSQNTVTNLNYDVLAELQEIKDIRLYTIPGYTVTKEDGTLAYEIDLFAAKDLLKPFNYDSSRESYVYAADAMVKSFIGDDYEVLVNSGVSGTAALGKEFLGSKECEYLNSFFEIELGHNFGITVNVLTLALWNEKAETNAGCAFVYHTSTDGDIKVLGERILTHSELLEMERFISQKLN